MYQILHQGLKEAGHILLSSAAPWVSKNSLPRQLALDLLLRSKMSHENLPEALNLEADTLFGAFALCAVMFEANEQGEELCQQIKASPIPLLASLGWLLSAHFEPPETVRVQAAMDHCGFTTEQQTFAWRWIRGEVQLVG